MIAELSSSGSGSAGEEGQLQLVQSYGTFLGLLAVNATAIASGYGWYRCKKAGWEAHPDHGDHDSQFTDLDSVNAEEVAREGEPVVSRSHWSYRPFEVPFTFTFAVIECR